MRRFLFSASKVYYKITTAQCDIDTRRDIWVEWSYRNKIHSQLISYNNAKTDHYLTLSAPSSLSSLNQR